MLVKDEKPRARAFTMQPQAKEVTLESLLVEDCAISTSSTVASRDAVLRAGLFDENFRRCEDFDLWLRMAFAGARMAFHSDAQVYHRISSTGLSANRWEMKRDRIRVYQKIGTTLPVTETQKRVINEMVAKTEAECDVEALKGALEMGDYDTAVKAADRASSVAKNWKVRLSLA